MSRISFKEEGEEHNFWQNYTDLMSGFLIVFIITSLIAYGSYKVYVDLYHSKGITEGNINDIVVNAELYKKIKDGIPIFNIISFFFVHIWIISEKLLIISINNISYFLTISNFWQTI